MIEKMFVNQTSEVGSIARGSDSKPAANKKGSDAESFAEVMARKSSASATAARHTDEGHDIRPADPAPEDEAQATSSEPSGEGKGQDKDHEKGQGERADDTDAKSAQTSDDETEERDTTASAALLPIFAPEASEQLPAAGLGLEGAAASGLATGDIGTDEALVAAASAGQLQGSGSVAKGATVSDGVAPPASPAATSPNPAMQAAAGAALPSGQQTAQAAAQVLETSAVAAGLPETVAANAIAATLNGETSDASTGAATGTQPGGMVAGQGAMAGAAQMAAAASTDPAAAQGQPQAPTVAQGQVQAQPQAQAQAQMQADAQLQQAQTADAVTQDAVLAETQAEAQTEAQTEAMADSAPAEGRRASATPAAGTRGASGSAATGAAQGLSAEALAAEANVEDMQAVQAMEAAGESESGFDPLAGRFVNPVLLPQMLAEAAVRAGGASFRAETPRLVAGQLAEAATRGARRVEIILSPRELGKVNMRMSTTDTGVVMHIQAERPETEDMMRRHIHELAKEFREMGFSDVEFTFGSEGGSEQMQAGAEGSGGHRGGDLDGEASDVDDDTDQLATEDLNISAEALDIRV